MYYFVHVYEIFDSLTTTVFTHCNNITGTCTSQKNNEITDIFL